MWFDSRLGQEIYFFSETSGPTMGPRQPPILANRVSLQRVKEPEREVILSPPPNVKLENEWHCPSSPPYGSMSCKFTFLSNAKRAE